jgi:hypothetical protein
MPLREFHIDTPLSPAAALERLRTLVRAPTPFRFWGPTSRDGDAPFIGHVRDNTFEFSRDIGYRNSFLPEISGSVVERKGGSRIEVEMWMHPFVMIFCSLWIGITSIAFVVSLINGTSGSALPAIGLVGAGAAIMALGFVPEANIARRLLTNAFDASADATRAD